MIETVMFIALGFVTACLLALALAPALWRRAVRLTRREIEATMPISVSDIQADKDILRAEHAVELRRLELALDQASQRAARHLMERNRHMVEMGKLESEVASLKDAIAERTKAGSVMEQTVRKRLPELEQELSEARMVIAAREQELAERAQAFENQTESLELAQAMIRRQEEEIDRLRAALEVGSGILTRWGKSAKSDEATSELARKNGELQAELSRLREKISLMQDVDEADTAELRAELHRLANLMVGGARPAARKNAAGRKRAAGKDDKAETRDKEPAPQDKPGNEDSSAQKKKTPAKGKRKSLIGRLSGLKSRNVKEPA